MTWARESRHETATVFLNIDAMNERHYHDVDDFHCVAFTNMRDLFIVAFIKYRKALVIISKRKR